jgi:hypothetical protein
MFAGGGSIQNMLVTLKNNKNLLRKRKSIFLRKSEFKRLRETYKEASRVIVNERKATKEELEQIRQRVLAERKKDIRIQLVILTIVGLVVVSSGIFILNNVRTTRIESEKISQAQLIKETKLNYRESMTEGSKMMDEEQWFYAAGYFENALTYVPNDPEAEYNLALAYCQLCFNEESACKKANELVDKMIKENSQSEKYRELKAQYLESSKTRK